MTIKFRPLKNPSTFRRIAAVMWKEPTSPAIFGSLDLEMTRALAYLEKLNQKSAVKITITHLVARAVALALAAHPELNAKVRWGKVLVRDRVDLFLQVSTDGGRDLSGVKVEAVDKLTLEEIATVVRRQAKSIRAGDDPTYKKSRNLFKILPTFLFRPILRLVSFLTNDLHFHFPSLGMPRDPFGSAMVTSVGMFGIETGFAPFPTISRCPIVLVVTACKDRPWVEDGEVVVRPVIRLCGTFDHRILDGFQSAQISDTVSEYIRDPEAREAALAGKSPSSAQAGS